ncbi:putative membrane protein (plasmid) [Rhodococcus opacus]|uniref:Putative membrane protein n=1 Tax=Rhodococcus opacus TaxID=37919 RepID=A0A1B1KH38_RHOOP|nr:multidrug efflux SMR transporter [Rhodococcus opacus]ANS31914.1 putative membrane protein [Rhodococcus opacus]
MSWFFLIGATLSECAATLSLRMASRGGSKKWFIVVVFGFVAAFGFLTLALDSGLAVGVAYGIWAAAGVALTALASRALFGEPLTKVMGFGIGLIIAGVLFIELGADH